jgi:hypothetical protein
MAAINALDHNHRLGFDPMLVWFKNNITNNVWAVQIVVKAIWTAFFVIKHDFISLIFNEKINTEKKI